MATTSAQTNPPTRRDGESIWAWRQKVAAYWSITWPAWIGAAVLAFFITAFSRNLRSSIVVMSVVENVFFFSIQAILTGRLVRKTYQSFRIYVVREDGNREQRFSASEAISVWLWIFWPQLAFYLLMSTVGWLMGHSLTADPLRRISTVALWGRFLVVGPYALDLALRVKHAGFRLETCGFRYV